MVLPVERKIETFLVLNTVVTTIGEKAVVNAKGKAFVDFLVCQSVVIYFLL